MPWDYRKESEYEFLMDAIIKSSMLQTFLTNLTSFNDKYDELHDIVTDVTDKLIKLGKELEVERRSVCKCP
jgi:hypothetical protein